MIRTASTNAKQTYRMERIVGATPRLIFWPLRLSSSARETKNGNGTVSCDHLLWTLLCSQLMVIDHWSPISTHATETFEVGSCGDENSRRLWYLSWVTSSLMLTYLGLSLTTLRIASHRSSVWWRQHDDVGDVSSRPCLAFTNYITSPQPHSKHWRRSSHTLLLSMKQILY